LSVGWRVEGGFGLDRLARCELPETSLGPGQARVAVKAVSLNYRDLLMVQGHYDPRQPLPLVPCSDAVAEVLEVAHDVTRVAVGDRVCPTFAAGWFEGSPDPHVLRRTRGGPLQGTLRTEMVVNADDVVVPPAHFTDVEASTLPCAAVTAWRALVTEGGVGPGDVVLTLGTGGVSLFALQIARMCGARVVITSSSDDKLARAKEMGAEHGVNYTREPSWGKVVRAWRDGVGVDHVLELGGAGTLDQSLRAVRTGGHVSLIGVLAGVKTPLVLTRVLMHHLRVQGIMVGARSDLEGVCRAYAAHPEMRPVVDRTFGLSQVPEAFQYLASARHMGKVVVDLTDRG
jgi:NADPH:quinone reductase-like Zn-dependent oxidoreductase